MIPTLRWCCAFCVPPLQSHLIFTVSNRGEAAAARQLQRTPPATLGCGAYTDDVDEATPGPPYDDHSPLLARERFMYLLLLGLMLPHCHDEESGEDNTVVRKVVPVLQFTDVLRTVFVIPCRKDEASTLSPAPREIQGALVFGTVQDDEAVVAAAAIARDWLTRSVAHDLLVRVKCLALHLSYDEVCRSAGSGPTPAFR